MYDRTTICRRKDCKLNRDKTRSLAVKSHMKTGLTASFMVKPGKHFCLQYFPGGYPGLTNPQPKARWMSLTTSFFISNSLSANALFSWLMTSKSSGRDCRLLNFSSASSSLSSENKFILEPFRFGLLQKDVKTTSVTIHRFQTILAFQRNWRLVEKLINHIGVNKFSPKED